MNWTNSESEASEIITDSNGTFNVKGLSSGEYILSETSTLDGFNILIDTITVVIKKDGSVTYRMTNSGTTEENYMDVVNETGTQLP